ncbi:LysR family transcriptional regulator [Bdellovibrio sp. HCB337]|uniref:LysR family transcriptional regulator n=1 Tax=Bdellovibrio sp. HCB337 TaxID=3394358 RepID=UPI0039A6B295
MNQPNLYHLQYFITAARLGSVAAAAQALSVSQPAISQGIKKLEEIFECELLIHSKNRFKITPEGQLLLERSEGVFGALENLKQGLKGLQGQVTGPLRIATSSSAAQTTLPGVLTRFLKKHPEVRPLVSIGTALEIVNHVKSGRSEIGIVVDDGSVRGVSVQILHEGHFQCVASSRLNQENIKHHFIATQERPGAEELKKAYEKKYDELPHIKMEVENWEAIAEMARQGMGIGFIPDVIASAWSGVKPVEELEDIGRKITYKLMLIHSGEHQLSKQAQAFIEAVSSEDLGTPRS